MSSDTSLGVPPEIGVRASLPNTGPRRGVRASAISSDGETLSRRAFTIPRSRDSGFSAWVEYTRNGFPSHAAEYAIVLPPLANRPLSMAPRRKVTRWKVDEGVRDVQRRPNMTPAASRIIPAAAAIIHAYGRGGFAEICWTPDEVPEIDSSANARSRADSKRSSGFFSRH